MRRALFLRFGSFSLINDSLVEALRAERPDVDFIDVDLKPVASGALLKAVGVVEALGREGVGALSTRERLRYLMLRSRSVQRAMASAARTAARIHQVDAVIQTQGLFDGRQPGLPHVIYTDHVALAKREASWSDGSGEPPAWWVAAESRLYRGSRAVCSCGKRVARILVEDYGLDPSCAVVAGGGPNIDSVDPDLNPSRYAAPLIAFVGVEWERKGGPELVEGFRALRARRPDARLVVAGCSPPIDEPGVEVLGRRPIAEIGAILRSASVFCMPSKLEPFGIAFIEAARAGLPVIAANVGELRDIVEDGVTGRLVPPGDGPAVGRALIEVADPVTAHRMGVAARAKSLNFNWRRTASSVLAALE